MKRWKTKAALLALLIVLIVISLRTHRVYEFPFTDFGEYWAAAHLLLNGQDPYSPPNLYAVQKSLGFHQDDPIMMWNPPWTLTFIIPFALVPFRLAAVLWLLFHCVIIVISAVWLWRLYGGPADPQTTRLRFFITAAFLPASVALAAGHVTPLMLLGFTGLLRFEREKRFFLAGLFASLLTLKPHVLYLVALFLAYHVITKRCWNMMAGAVTGVAVLLVLPFAIDRMVVFEYIHSIRTFPMLGGFAPNYGGVLRYAFGFEHRDLQFLPSLFGLVFLIYFIGKYADRPWAEELPLLAIVSVVTSAYGWSCDQVVLLPAIVYVATMWLRQRNYMWPLAIYLFANALIVIHRKLQPHEFYVIWTGPLWLLLYCVGLREARRRARMNAEAAPPGALEQQFQGVS